MSDYWNHNTHYHRLVLDAVPENSRTALDVGCGEGLLVRRLARRIPEMTGIDRHHEMIALARERGGGTFIEGDFLGHDFPDGRYDLVTCVTAVHHMDFTAAVTKMARLVRPGGRLVIVGLAATRTPVEYVVSAAGVPVNRVHRALKDEVDPGAPVQDPTMRWGEVRRAARALLPGARWRRHLLWRYSIVWTRPGSAGVAGQQLA